MAAFTRNEIEQAAEGILEDVGPTLEIHDIGKVLPRLMEIVERIETMTNEERHQTVVDLIGYVIDETDTPWLPDPVTDPIVKKLVASFIMPLCKASKGEYEINQD